MLENLQNKKIGIVGFGIEGVSVAKFLLKKDIPFSILDKKSEQELQAIYPAMYNDLKEQGILFICGEDYLSHIAEFDVIVRSPGISILTSELVAAQKKGIIVTSLTKLFFELCPAPIIGVTGTKGKGTTSTLIANMLTASGKKAFLGGNIGQPPLDFLDDVTKDSIVVLELSSFQLQDMTQGPTDAKAMAGKPHIAVVLMITSEHLDYHATTEEYVDAKRNILRFQKIDDYAVINRDYPASNESDIHTEGNIYFVSREREVIDQGCFVKEHAVWIRKNGKDEKIIEVSEIALLGKHNLENVCAAVMAASLANVSKEAMVSALKTFAGLEHRLELVGEIHGVKYYDDSFSTTPETAIAAIESFDQPEILILGGSSKGADFTELGHVISQARNIKAIIGIGKEWEKIKESFTADRSPQGYSPLRGSARFTVIEGAKTMKEIILEASEIAESGDVVLLSPACASFGMFANYKDRGEQFKREVLQLKEFADDQPGAGVDL
ncbi:MAG TPA: UDP-N-acetylmuramoyl-L-alanine--D-glutamate ligase [Candidatus Saccharimonadales bacterium]|nr:UDP-N-acetylmuramoyl-L-alanine--D-glutamate ligase [Candidatus Saccharimonadales bacterium]